MSKIRPTNFFTFVDPLPLKNPGQLDVEFERYKLIAESFRSTFFELLGAKAPTTEILSARMPLISGNKYSFNIELFPEQFLVSNPKILEILTTIHTMNLATALFVSLENQSSNLASSQFVAGYYEPFLEQQLPTRIILRFETRLWKCEEGGTFVIPDGIDWYRKQAFEWCNEELEARTTAKQAEIQEVTETLLELCAAQREIEKLV
jgi:hypothetical protein